MEDISWHEFRKTRPEEGVEVEKVNGRKKFGNSGTRTTTKGANMGAILLLDGAKIWEKSSNM
jgi:hypothetical protein